MARPPKPLEPRSGLWAYLGWELRRLREAHALTQTEAAKIVGYEPGVFSKWELGVLPPPEAALIKLDETWGTGGRLAHLRYFALTTKQPVKFMALADYEAQATMIRICEVLWVPGLFQTPEYARMAFEAFGVDPETEVPERLERQKILTKDDPPYLSVLLAETALMQIPAVIARGQLERLLEASTLPNVTLRLVPVGAGLHVGLNGAFQILTTPEAEIAHADTGIGGMPLAEVTDLRKLAIRFDRISAVALSTDATRSRLREMIERLRSDPLAQVEQQ